VRDYFIGNALMWFRDFHVDALRLDAIHGIVDTTARPFLLELAEATQTLAAEVGRPVYLIAESDLNEPRVVSPPEHGGYGLDAQWNDDFHHAVHALISGERSGYYADFGSMRDVATALTDGFVFQGQHSAFRNRRHGNSSKGIPASRLVAFVQNHDQVGNRAAGDRLSSLIPFERQKLAAGLLLLSPFVPLLFMGEEYGEEAPFPYFVSHSEPELVQAVRRGRAEEFAAFDWQGEVPDPQDVKTFLSAKLDPELRDSGRHQALWQLHQELLRLRRSHPALSHLSNEPTDLEVAVDEEHGTLTLLRQHDGSRALCLFNVSEASERMAIPAVRNSWRLVLASSDERCGGPGHGLPHELRGESIDIPADSFAVYEAAG
jgi:maltooligosyltrehalose trehalohydrolase